MFLLVVSDALFEAMEEDMPEYGVYTEEMDIVFNQDELPHSNNGDVPANANVHSRSKDLTPTQRQQIYEALLERSVNGKLRKNSTKRVAEMFKVHQAAVWRIWKRAKECREKGIPVDISSRKPKNSGRKRAQVDLSQVQTIPLRRRSTLRSLAEALDADKSTIHRLFKRGLLRRHSNTIKPYLTESNKKERLRWCVSMLDTSL
jgi:primosomal protein N''